MDKQRARCGQDPSVRRLESSYYLLGLSVALLLCIGPRRIANAAAADGPTAAVQETADAVVAVLANKSLGADQKRAQIEQIVYAHFDFTTLSKLVLARNWKQLSPAQQHDFVEEFKRHLSVTYGRNVESYNDEHAVITGDREESNGDWTVKTKIIRPNAADVLVDYRLRKQDGGWQVIDVIIEGVSLVANFRSQFQEILTGSNADNLIKLLREKNAKGEPLKS
jgi:phospholipid transport system substrate-binding protein